MKWGNSIEVSYSTIYDLLFEQIVNILYKTQQLIVIQYLFYLSLTFFFVFASGNFRFVEILLLLLCGARMCFNGRSVLDSTFNIEETFRSIQCSMILELMYSFT